jgi:hypothetical protein
MPEEPATAEGMQLAALSCRDELSTVLAAAPPCFDDQLALDFAINV